MCRASEINNVLYGTPPAVIGKACGHTLTYLVKQQEVKYNKQQPHRSSPVSVEVLLYYCVSGQSVRVPFSLCVSVVDESTEWCACPSLSLLSMCFCC